MPIAALKVVKQKDLVSVPFLPRARTTLSRRSRAALDNTPHREYRGRLRGPRSMLPRHFPENVIPPSAGAR